MGSTGERHAATADSIGWQQWSVDLSRFAGQQVELSISSATSFEADLGGWTVSGAPAGSAPNPRDWQRDQLAFDEGAVAVTDDTVFAGFGLEGLAPRERDDFVARALEHLLG